MEQHPGPVLPSQRYSPASEYAFEGDHEVMPLTRRPLGESTGNVQPHNLAALALCNHSLSPPIRPIPTPPIVPTQALPSSYGTSLRGGRSLHRDVSLRESPMGYPRGSKNPIYAYKHFADYRNKVMQKELEKEQPIWPLWLEDAFLDALLLIPQMGRKKFSSKTILYGRNMLITEYLWIYHWLLHPPKNGEAIPNRQLREKGPNGKPHPMYRGRKQVSSHIQVLKGFFATMVTFHFIFPSKKDGKEDDRKLMREDDDTESFKNNRVLISIADGRLPDERPNYDYFARLLNADNDVFLRPKQCWVFVSSSQVNLKEKHLKMDDGTTKKQVTGYTSNGHWLGEADYPHLKLNDSKDYKDLPRNGDRPTILLHEYTRPLAQKESSSVKDISNQWDIQFPELKEKLFAALDDTNPLDERSSRCVVGPCDTFHFKVTLDLHATSKFPDGSELNGMVELSINRPELHNHSWRSVTSVVKPDELHISGSEPDFWDRTNPVEVVVSHRPGCNGLGRCDCASRGSRDTIGVPFPAASWANTFIKLAPYVTAERDRRDRKDRKGRDQDSQRSARPSRAERDTARTNSNDGTSSHKPGGGKMPTPKDLLSQVAMYQEIWSTPNNGGVEPGKRGWTRRSVILWTFEPVHDRTDEKNKTTTVAPGTSWRFLTKVDPTSEYHQQRAYLSGSPSVSRDSVMSPNPGYQHHVNAARHENMNAAYDMPPALVSTTLPSHPQSQHAHVPPGLDLLDGFDNGLVTPPPTASLTGSYPHNFEGGPGTLTANGVESSLHHQLSFISDGSGTAVEGGGGGGVDTGADNFLSGLSVPVSSWAAATQHNGLGLDTTSWGGPGWAGGAGGLTSATTSASAADSLWAATAPTTAQNSRDGSFSSASTSHHWAAGDDKDAAAHHHHHPHQYQQPDPWAPWQQPAHADAPGAGGEPASWDVDAQDFSLDMGAGPATGLTPLRSHRQLQAPQAMTGRKRSRTDSVDDEDDGSGDDDTAYPAHSLRKLSHPQAPTAVMDRAGGYM
ncbi:hypothetical protein GGR52DRAFT_578838 [Hypoxylon sp. FL1284]|nr:hypothetical protein GGR52DRAFT_578838 [Hypoxylon sp. FL1284]